MKIARVVAPAILSFVLAAGAVQADTLSKVQSEKKIRVAIDPSVPPWSYKNEKLEMTGSEVEVARLLASSLGAELEIVPTNGANRIPFLLSGKADVVISALSITPERSKTIAFSKPYSGVSTVVAAPKGVSIRSIEDLSGKRVAVTRGTTNDSDVTARAPKDTQVVRFEDEATTITAVVSNQVDIVAQAPTLIKIINERNVLKNLEPKFVLSNLLFGVGIRKEDAALKERIDQWVGENIENGQLNEIYRKYQGVDMPSAVAKPGQ